MRFFKKTVTVSKNIDVDIDIALDDVREFISGAEKEELEEVATALAEHDIHASLTKLHGPTIQYLINRANQFGLDDMLDELKREGHSVGAYLDTGAKA